MRNKACRFIPTALVVALCTIPLAVSGTQATVAGHVLTSTGFPTGTIEFTPDFAYIGAESFVLYGVADCEIHLFADVQEGRLRRLYWIQFEGYLPKKKRHNYDYSDSDDILSIGGHDFHEDRWVTNIETSRKRWRTGSDIEHVFALLDDRGITVGTDLMGIRLVRLNADRRKELMIIYYEDLALVSLTAAELKKGGKAFGQATAILDRLRQRALAGMTHEMD